MARHLHATAACQYERFVRKNRPRSCAAKAHAAEPAGAPDALRTHRGGARPDPHPVALDDPATKAEETQDFQAAEGRNMNDYLDFLLTMDRSLSPAQRTHLLNELKAWRRDFERAGPQPLASLPAM